MRPIAAAVRLAVAYAVLGTAGAFALAFLSGGREPDLLVTAVLVVTLVFAAVVVAAVAVLVERGLRGRIDDGESRVEIATMAAAGLVLLSGVLTIDSLGVVALAAAGVMALVTHLVLRRSAA